MTTVRIGGQLRAMVGAADHQVSGDRVIDALRALEVTYPQIAGWILDERGVLRRHLNVFVDGQPATGETAVQPSSRIHVLPSITGG
jgi:molybdopterin converting factor small subunit